MLAASPSAFACRLERRALLPVAFHDGFATIPAAVQGHPARFIVDTGSEEMLVTPDSATRFGLAADPAEMRDLIGTGGSIRVGTVRLAGVRLGAASLPAQTVPSTPLPAATQSDGLLGAPLALRYDIDLDLIGGTIGLYHARDCAQAPLLPPPFTTVPLTATATHALLVPVLVNGVRLSAILDSGSRATLLTPGAANRAGVSVLGGTGSAPGLDGHAVRARSARVTTLVVGYDQERGMQVGVAPIDLGGADMLLGLDWLRQRHVWVSVATKRLSIALRYDWPQAARR